MMKVATFHRRAREEWFTSTDVPLSNEEIDRLLHSAYTKCGLDVLTTGANLRREASGWIVGIDDADPNYYRWFIAYKKTPYGNKIIFSGNDGQRESTSELKRIRMGLYNNPSDHFYSEASGPWEHLLEKWGIPKVPFSEAQEVLSGKTLTPEPDNEFSYTRAIGGKQVRKVMFGFPKVAASLSSWFN